MEHEIYLSLMDHDARLKSIEEILIKEKLMEAAKEEETEEPEEPEEEPEEVEEKKAKKKKKVKFP